MDVSSKPTAVDASAPIVSRRSIAISAPLERIWQLHTDVNGWPTWQSDIRSAHLSGALCVGSTFTWQTEGLDDAITSEVYAIEPPVRTFWGGTVMGILGLHEWHFARNDSETLVSTEESWSGEPTLQNTRQLQLALDQSLDRWLTNLKGVAER